MTQADLYERYIIRRLLNLYVKYSALIHMAEMHWHAHVSFAI